MSELLLASTGYVRFAVACPTAIVVSILQPQSHGCDIGNNIAAIYGDILHGAACTLGKKACTYKHVCFALNLKLLWLVVSEYLYGEVCSCQSFNKPIRCEIHRCSNSARLYLGAVMTVHLC